MKNLVASVYKIADISVIKYTDLAKSIRLVMLKKNIYILVGIEFSNLNLKIANDPFAWDIYNRNFYA